jgi:hypothetical protein
MHPEAYFWVKINIYYPNPYKHNAKAQIHGKPIQRKKKLAAARACGQQNKYVRAHIPNIEISIYVLTASLKGIYAVLLFFSLIMTEK